MSQKIIADMKQYKKKQKIIIAIIFFTVFAIIILGIRSSIKNKNAITEIEKETGNFASIENILKHYGCKYIKDGASKEKGYYWDIYTEFKVDLYNSDDTSNEEFYNDIINSIAKFVSYKSFRIFDESKDITIETIGNGSYITTIYINGMEDYFIYMDSQNALKEYEEIPNVSLDVQSKEIKNCIQNSWNSNMDFGTRETIFQKYNIYFDEGIETRTINKKIYNIVFTENYKNPVVNGLTVGTDDSTIIKELGAPSFKNEDSTIIGYKSDDIYIFFEKNQISVYRNIKESGFDDFFELIDKFLNDEYELLEFMSELTDIWPDYAEYEYDDNKVFLSYPNKGIDIKINYDNTNGIVLYNNVQMSEKERNEYLKHTEFVALLKVDNVYNAETRRYENLKNLGSKCDKFEEEYVKKNDRNTSDKYKCYADLDSQNSISAMYFISKDGYSPNCELNEGIYSYIWINDDCIAYSQYGKGIYFYDLKNQTKGTIITGNDDYKIESYEDNILKYDDEEMNVQY